MLENNNVPDEHSLCHSVQHTFVSLRAQRGNLPEGTPYKSDDAMYCLWQKRCTFGAMCAFGTLRIKSTPRVLNIVLLNRHKLDGFLGFLTGSCEGGRCVLVVRNWARFCKNAEKALISSQTSLLTKQTLYVRLFVFCLFAPCPHGYTVSRGVPKLKIVRILMRKIFFKNGKNLTDF